MDFDQARIEIQQWIIDFVERPNPKLNGWPPCPYARQARLQNKIKICKGLDPFGDLLRLGSIHPFDVIAFVYDPKIWLGDEFEFMIHNSNRGFLHERNLHALSDHPDCPEIVNDVILNQGTYAISFVQELDKLNSAAGDLAKKEYYKDWPEQYLKDLFHLRDDPRK
jgi:hypothetical protein